MITMEFLLVALLVVALVAAVSANMEALELVGHLSCSVCVWGGGAEGDRVWARVGHKTLSDSELIDASQTH